MLRRDQQAPSPQQQAWLDSKLQALKPAALEQLDRDLKNAADCLDLRATFFAFQAANEIDPAWASARSAAVFALRDRVLAGEIVKRPVWSMGTPKGRFIPAPFVEGDTNTTRISVEPNKGDRLLRITVTVENVSAASDPAYAGDPMSRRMAAFLGGAHIAGDLAEPGKPARLAHPSHIYLVTGGGRVLMPCSYVLPESKTLRGASMDFRGANKRVWTGNQVAQGRSFLVDVLFSAPQDLRRAGLLFYGATVSEVVMEPDASSNKSAPSREGVSKGSRCAT
jgi:hypothetical protein